MSYLSFNELNNPGHKTRLWEVWANASDNILGKIRFWGAWRKYTFAPAQGTVFDASCMREIADFTEAETKKWREGLQRSQP